MIGIAALVVTAAVISFRKKSHHNKASPVPGPPGAIDKKYAQALSFALQFFDIQKCTMVSLLIFSLFLFFAFF